MVRGQRRVKGQGWPARGSRAAEVEQVRDVKPASEEEDVAEQGISTAARWLAAKAERLCPWRLTLIVKALGAALACRVCHTGILLFQKLSAVRLLITLEWEVYPGLPTLAIGEGWP